MAGGTTGTMSRTTYLALAVAARVLTDVPLLWMFVLIHFGLRGDGGAGNTLWNAGAFTGWAVLHSLLARDAARRVVSRWLGLDFVRIAYVVVAGLTLALLLLVWRPVSGELWHATGAVAGVLSALYLASLVGLVLITSHFDYAEFLGLRQIKSRVTGRPPRPPALSLEGPYGYCRHPMYLAMLAAFWVGPVMSSGRLEFAALSTLYLFVGLRLEEHNLRRELGPEYDLYRANVPMLIPRLTPWRLPQRTADRQEAAGSGTRS
jgi:protein-S-isoprenylcysteine O-methyltransferase Ste14